MNTERLLRLADHLERVVARLPETFDMGVFGRRGDCGTACCALGHACSIPEFAEAGLRLRWDNNNGADVTFSAQGRVSMNFKAAAEIFDINILNAEYLFYPECYGEVLFPDITPHMVAARIRDLVATANK